MTWYAAKGDPRYDRDELWTAMGHLYKGGMWFKKKVDIGGFNANFAVDYTDWRTDLKSKSWSISNTLPSAADAGNYFYLPALGNIFSGQLEEVGYNGKYWSSTANPLIPGGAYHLGFSLNNVYVGSYNSFLGYSVGAFE